MNGEGVESDHLRRGMLDVGTEEEERERETGCGTEITADRQR